MEDVKISLAIITEGRYEIIQDCRDNIIKQAKAWFMEWACVDNERKLYIVYNYENFYENDSQDFQYIVKVNNIDTENIQTVDLIDLTDDDIEYIKKYHGLFFAMYSYWSQTVLHFITKTGAIDISKWNGDAIIDRSDDRDTIIKKCEYKLLSDIIGTLGDNKC